MIRFESVTKIYPKAEKPALDNVTIDVEKGEFVFLVGLSGSGKSTLTDLLLGLQIPDEGEVLIDDVPAAAWNLNSFRKGASGRLHL